MSTDKKTADWYNDRADHYTAHVRNPDDSIYHSYYEKPAMYSLLPDLKNKNVLSIGCGPGEDSNYLQLRGSNRSVGVDLSPAFVDIAKKSYPNCEFEVMDMEKLNFQNEIFDLAYSSLAIHYIEDWTVAFKEAYRVLKPNSYFIFSCIHPVRGAMKVKNSDDNKIFEGVLSISADDTHVEIIGDYMNQRKLIDGLGKDTVNLWSKPLSQIVTEIKSAGFSIDTIVEPLPQEDMRDVSLVNYERLKKVPEFLIFRVLKP